MLKLLADECFNNDIVRGCIRRAPALDFVRVQDVGLMHAEDPDVLAWAAAEGRILCTHDVTTVPTFAYERVARGQPMPGVLAVRWTMPVAAAISELVLIVLCTEPEEWRDQVGFLPIR